MKYSKQTLNDCLTLEWENTNIMKWSADAAFAVHPDCKSHSGYAMTAGKGYLQAASKKQKLNTRSSTEAELIAADDAMTQVL